MPTVNTPTLTLITINQDVTIQVTFNAVFTPFERQLAGLGMDFHEHIDVEGVDALIGTFITTFARPSFPVTVGAGNQIIARNVSRTVPRALLQEDTGLGDNDEIRCKILIHAVGLPAAFTSDVFTPVQILIG